MEFVAGMYILRKTASVGRLDLLHDERDVYAARGALRGRGHRHVVRTGGRALEDRLRARAGSVAAACRRHGQHYDDENHRDPGTDRIHAQL